jgi:hypothetical protein
MSVIAGGGTGDSRREDAEVDVGEPPGSGRHHNIFMYYRGPAAKKETESDAHRQIEDNATKALINVLEHGSPQLAQWFAECCAPTIAQAWPRGAAASFYLQGGPRRLPAGPRILLGLSIAGELDPDAPPGKPLAGSRIDAAILSPVGGLIAIETKVVDRLDPHQLARHRARWQIQEADTVLARWVDIWSWARTAHVATPTSDAVSRFLLDQFREYLEILGFGRWAGFREEDFQQFTTWSWDHQPVLRARMRSCWERVLELMPEPEAAWLGRIGSGRLPKGQNHAWAQTNRDQHGTNLTLELHPDELQFNLVGWNHPQAQRLAAWLLAHPDDAPDLDLIIHERHAKADHKGTPFWMHATAATPMTFTAAEVRAGRFAAWLDQWHRQADHTWTRLAYHLRHTWPRDEVLSRGEHLGPEIAALAGRSVPLLRAINGWKTTHVPHEASSPPTALAERAEFRLGPAHLAGEILEYEGNVPLPPGYKPTIVEDTDIYD